MLCNLQSLTRLLISARKCKKGEFHEKNIVSNCHLVYKAPCKL